MLDFYSVSIPARTVNGDLKCRIYHRYLFTVFCILLLLDDYGQQKEASGLLKLWELGVLVLLVSAATGQGPDSGGAAAPVVRDPSCAL